MSPRLAPSRLEVLWKSCYFSLRISQKASPMNGGRVYEFGPFRLDTGGHLLFREGQRTSLTPKAVEVLIALVEAQGAVLAKEELLKRVWADAIVEEGSLASHISLLRKTLGEDYIETIPKRGYRFVAAAKPVAEAGERRPQIRSLAVLPLDNLGRDADGDRFADSMTEALITRLAKIRALRVVSRTSVLRYKDTQKSMPEIGKELGVDGLVEGSVQLEGDRVRINARLVCAASDEHLWAESYDQELRDVLILQNEVARAIAKEIQITLTPEERARLAGGRAVDPEAFQLYLKGRHVWVQRTEESLDRAISYFEAAIARDPDYAAAYSGLADCYSSLAFSFDIGSQRPVDVQPKARAAALKAIALDEALAEAHTSLAYVMLNYDWDWDGAEAEFKRSLLLNPGYAHGHHWYAHLLLSRGGTVEALAESYRALELDPLSPIMNLHLGWHYLYSQEYDRALDQLGKTLELDPNYGLAHWYRGLVYEQKGMYEDAQQELIRAKDFLKTNLTVDADQARIYAACGNRSRADRTIAKLKRESSRRYVNPYQIALVYAGLQQPAEAFDWLEKALHERSDLLVYLKIDSRLNPLRADSRFAAFERRVGIPN